ncbi:tripartite tricarboxylate transporter substrate binding protein [Variovorax sp. OV700]|uniref:Bug family tripartite tricarboxylate transporter substrate binding protein n=1 Tax=Variovorax sp. OV700 TaxID=1882826 RepID=UPI00088AB0E6|nr:tripartite tricarboxylate transporter substrate binding protein [Variovorax sp. OV700]SDH83697.1 Tripartite-type tricarboxylate transporter, receptor component TctC [Variovorax sp. OV700]
MSASTLSRRDLMKWGVAATLGAPLPHAFAQSVLPKGPITLVVPFSAGGATDVVSRLVAQKLSERIAHSVVVENAAGGGGAIGAAKVAKAAADGSVLLMGTVATHAINPLSTPPSPYDAQRDFAPISLIATVPNVLLVSASVKAQNVQELIAQLKAQPGKFSYGSSGVGTPPHLSGELFKSMAGVDIGHVPYKGGGPAMTDLVGGHIPILFDVLTGAASHIRAGSARALAVTTSKRSPSFPDVPTLAEAGLPGYETYTWNAVFGPAKLQRPLVELLSRELQAVVAMPDVQAKLKDLSAVPVGSTPEVLDALVKSELGKWGAVIKSIGGLKRE